ncbi:MAG: hypothetical protein FWC65_01955 [Treponema sp.]|nr:hypothetical protein [Treponema sp.]
MRVIEIKDLTRKDVPIYYRRHYSGTAVMELVSAVVDVPLDFQIEHKPTGEIEVGINSSMAAVDYPLLPLHKELKRFIGTLDSTGQLPD